MCTKLENKQGSHDAGMKSFAGLYMQGLERKKTEYSSLDSFSLVTAAQSFAQEAFGKLSATQETEEMVDIIASASVLWESLIVTPVRNDLVTHAWRQVTVIEQMSRALAEGRNMTGRGFGNGSVIAIAAMNEAGEILQAHGQLFGEQTVPTFNAVSTELHSVFGMYVSQPKFPLLSE